MGTKKSEKSAKNNSTQQETNTVQREADGKFKAGTSGNPGGRPKGDAETLKSFRERVPRVLERLMFWLESNNSRASIAAAEIILERALGRVEVASSDQSDQPPIYNFNFTSNSEADQNGEFIFEH